MPGTGILVVTPANLRPQWIRELAERFQLDFVQLGAGQFDASLTENPWDQHDHIVVSRDFLRTDRAREAFEAAEKDWDLAVVDEAHGFTLAVNGEGHINKKSERYKAAESVARRSHRLILMTATPHSGRNASLWGAAAPARPGRVRGPLPARDPGPAAAVPQGLQGDHAGHVRASKLFKDRHPRRVEYELTADEQELYDAVTDFVANKLREIRGEQSRTTAASR